MTFPFVNSFHPAGSALESSRVTADTLSYKENLNSARNFTFHHLNSHHISGVYLHHIQVTNTKLECTVSVHLHVRGLIREAIYIKLLRFLYRRFTSPGRIALLPKLRNKLDWPPDGIERDN